MDSNEFTMPQGAVALTPLQLNGIRLNGHHTVLTPGLLTESQPDSQ